MWQSAHPTPPAREPPTPIVALSRMAASGGQWGMAITDRIKKFMQSPQGRKLVDTGQRELKKPENQRKLRELASKFTKRR